MITKKSVKLVPLTHELATKISTMPALPGEREKKTARLNFFRKHIKEGTFISPTWSLALNRETGMTHRADGQHSSFALAELPPEEFPAGLTATIQEYEIDSAEIDGLALFNTFDNPMANRTNTDVMGIHRAARPDLQQFELSFLVHVANGIDFYLKSLSLPQITTWGAREHGYYFDEPEYRMFAAWLHQWSKARNSWMIAKDGLVAEMLADWKASERVASQFWEWVLAENHPDAEHETRLLAEDLKKMRVKAPKVKRDLFRSKAQKVWKRFHRIQEDDRKRGMLPPEGGALPGVGAEA